jgi:hypothetical protein
LLWDVFGRAAGSAMHLSEGVAKRKLGILAAFSGRNTDSVSRLVKRGSQAANGIECDTRKRLWHRLDQPDLVDIITPGWINVDDSGERLCLEESVDLGLKIPDMPLGVGNTGF